MSDLTERQLYRAYIVERTIERAQRYLLEGRQNAQYSDELLPELWVALFRELTETGFGQDSIKRVIMDVEAEMGLRGLGLPIDQVQPELALFAKHVEQERREGQPAPADCSEVRAELADLRRRLNRPKH